MKHSVASHPHENTNMSGLVASRLIKAVTIGLVFSGLVFFFIMMLDISVTSNLGITLNEIEANVGKYLFEWTEQYIAQP